MAKTTANKPDTDLSFAYKSAFKLTFAVELLGLEDFAEPPIETTGLLELGNFIQGCKIQYQLYPNQVRDIDVIIYPTVARVWTNGNSCWIRIFRFLERKWFAFSINHEFPVRVTDLQNLVASVTVTMGPGVISANAKNDINFNEVIVPPLKFGERRYFAPVFETEETFLDFIEDLIWSCVVEHIPPCYTDQWVFEFPYAVADVRHQDACIEKIRDVILNTKLPEVPSIASIAELDKTSLKKESKHAREKEKEKKKPEAAKVKFEILLSGNDLLAGVGRIVQFETVGDRPPDLGEIIVLISSHNLPAEDDYPIVFVNVDNLYQIPLNELKDLSVTEVYTRWQIGETIHDSKPQPLDKSDSIINFSDHHAIPFPYEILMEVTADFLDQNFQVQLRGRRTLVKTIEPKLFGYEKGDRDFGTSVPPKLVEDNLDFLIAVTKIDAKTIYRGPNVFVRGEYPLFPPIKTLNSLNREVVCTNDINGIKHQMVPEIIVKPDTILLAQMTLEVNLGVVGCTPRKLCPGYSRMFSLINDSKFALPFIKCITETNEELAASGQIYDLLTGFALDTGNTVLLFLEGPKDGYILRIWDKTEDFYPDVKPLFSCSARYSSRVYVDFLSAAVPFNVLKMFVPLGVLLACPQVYTRPTLPLPTRSALLKINSIIEGGLRHAPSRNEMPTSAELKSFRLELCVAPRPSTVINVASEHQVPRHSTQSESRINWENKIN